MSPDGSQGQQGQVPQQQAPFYPSPSAPFQGGQQPPQGPGFQGGMPQGGMPEGMGPGMQGGMPGMMQGGMPGMVQGQMGQMGQMPPSGGPMAGGVGNGVPGEEESYIENILRLNRGKMATVYMTFENNEQWNAKVFKGILEAAGRDHIVLSDPETGRRYLLLMIYLDYVTFDEELNYQYPFG
ncbi:spore coat protein GerQ [Salinibacillus kushneri]|nr:spore coat protein GerQ [Salinibacillus kushneri]